MRMVPSCAYAYHRRGAIVRMYRVHDHFAAPPCAYAYHHSAAPSSGLGSRAEARGPQHHTTCAAAGEGGTRLCAKRKEKRRRTLRLAEGEQRQRVMRAELEHVVRANAAARAARAHTHRGGDGDGERRTASFCYRAAPVRACKQDEARRERSGHDLPRLGSHGGRALGHA